MGFVSNDLLIRLYYSEFGKVLFLESKREESVKSFIFSMIGTRIEEIRFFNNLCELENELKQEKQPED